MNQDYNIVLIQSISLDMHMIIPKLINEAGVNPDSPVEICGINKYSLIEAVRLGHIESVKAIVRCGASLTIRDDKGMTPLHHACMFENEDVFIFILESSQGGINTAAKDGRTPLDVAADYGNVFAISKLCSYGAMSGAGTAPDSSSKIHIENLTSIFDIHPLEFGKQVMRAVVYSDKQAIQELLKENRIPVDFSDDDGNTLLHIATKLFYIDIVKMLLEAGSDIYRENRQGIAPIDIASGINGERLRSIMIEHTLKNKTA